MKFITIALALGTIHGYISPEPDHYQCDSSVNFLSGMFYNQISLTDGCFTSDSGDLICNANPIYVPSAPPFASTDAAISYCQYMCSSVEEMENIGLTSERTCSPCTGFFFQRHGNGHEICGFFTDDMNDAKVNFSNHGHDGGSRVCIKSKLQIAFPVPSEITEENSEDHVHNWFFTVSTELSSGLRECHGYCGPHGTGECNQEPDLVWYCDSCNCKDYGNRYEEPPHRLLQESDPDVGIVDSCFEYDCSTDGLNPKSEVSSYCEGTHCDKWECCSFDAENYVCEIDKDCPQHFKCDKSPPPSFRRKLFGSLEIVHGKCVKE
ncbi:hypothetical protein TrLO_g4433 [Triparma laevis f. longispina]|uniref:Uncharacterized protein n=1 Tax=Triparma laevis f. longispina TaxID=1714387 RepID=A0A9W7FT71_9STRA|nr:hypothetical protein TrLO_g4433 [Triparma laevis f. longispina]